jgi:hypothetical protein
MSSNNPFDWIELEVIRLAANKNECTQVSGHLSRRAFQRLEGWVNPTKRVNPLGNERLEALRKLTCASLATSGRPSASQIGAARAAGITEAQIEVLKHWSSQEAGRVYREEGSS